MSDNRNDLPPVNSPNFLEKVREAISTYLGTRGDPLNRGLTVRDLADAGVIGLNPRYGGSGGRVNPVGGVGNAVTDVTLAVDLTPPPTPEGFAASAAFENIMVSVNAQTYTQGHGHGRTRLYGSTIAGTTFGDADLLMEFSGTVASYPATMGTTYYLWATNVSKDGVESVLPAPIGDVYGISVTTAPNIPDLLDALAGEITSSELSSDLNTRINLIDAAGTGLVPRMTATESRLADIDTTLADVINTPAYNPATTYAVGDMVQYEGALYRAILETTGNLPTDTVYWVKVADYTSLADAVAGHSVDLVVQAGYIGEIEYQDAIDRITVLGNKVIQKGDHIVALQQIGDNVAAITLEQGARVTDTGAIASKTEGMYTAFAGNTAAIVLERTTSATNEAAAASLTQTLYSAMGDSKAGLVTSYDTQATVNSALSSKVEVLKAETADGRAKLATEQTVRIDETAALAASATVLGSVFGAQKTALLETSSTLSTATEAVANKLLALNAVAGANAAGLIVERQTSATEVSAVASQLTALSSTVAGNQATLTNDYYTKADTKGAIASAQTTLRAFRPPSRVWKSDTQPTQGSTNVLLADGTSYAEPTLTVGDMWIDYADQNKSYQWDGTTWISARDTNPSALITNLEQTKIGYATKDGVVFDNGGLITNKTEMDAWNAANGGTDAVWHVGLPLAYAVKQVGVTTSARAVYRGTNPAFTATTEAGVTAWNTANPLDKAVWIPAETGTIESRTQALQDETGKLKLSYTIKLDNNGMMSGYGLYSEGATSQFIANVNQFAVTLPSTSIPDWAAGAKALGAIAKISGDTTSGKYLVCVKAGTSSSTAPSIAGLIGTIVTDGSVEWQIASRVPFAVVSAPTTIEGVPLPAGGYFDGAYIRNLNANFITAGTINGDIVNVTKALTAADVTAGAIWTGDVTSTSNTVIEGVSYPSFSINASTGLATFNNAVVRGTVYATAGLIGGNTIDEASIHSGTTGYGTGAGFYLGSNGTFSLSNKLTWNGTALAIDGTGSFSGALTAETIATASGKFAVSAGGILTATEANISGAITATSGTFAGSLSAATGTFSGTLTASAINAVSTINIGDEQVTVTKAATSDTVLSNSSTTEDLALSLAAITLNSSAKALITIGIYNTNGEYDAAYQVRRNGADITGWRRVAALTEVQWVHLDAPGAGSFTYTLYTRNAGSIFGPYATFYSVGRRYLTVIGCKK
jgi:hypothetical protein